MAFVWDWANANSGGLALLALLVVPLGAAIGFFAKHLRGVPVEKMLRDPASWQTLARTYQSTGNDAYFSALERILGVANRWYGEKLLSWRAYGTCLTLAFLYPVLALLLGWAAFNIWAPAGIEVFDNIDSGLDRAWRLALFIVSFGVCLYIVKNAEKFSRFMVDLLFKPLDDPNTRPGFLSKAGRVFVEYGAFTVAFAFALAVTVAATVAGAGAFALTVAGAGAVAIAGAFAFAFAATVAGAVGFAFAVAGALNNNDAALPIVLLYVILPVLNAAADMLSLAITRYFLAKVLAQKPAVWMILAQMLLDLLLAAGCLLLLLASLITALDLWQAISPATAPLDWRAFWASVHADPKQGIALYMMAATTLVPTVVHLIAGLGAVWTQKSRLLRPIAVQLAAQPVSTPFPEVEIDKMLRAIGRATLWGYAGASVVVILPASLLLWIVYSLIV